MALVGTNPPLLTVGDSYIDRGAVATDHQGHSLRYQTDVNGVVLKSPISLDTNTAATDTIDYVATDTWSDTATTTRTVIIQVAISTP